MTAAGLVLDAAEAGLTLPVLAHETGRQSRRVAGSSMCAPRDQVVVERRPAKPR